MTMQVSSNEHKNFLKLNQFLKDYQQKIKIGSGGKPQIIKPEDQSDQYVDYQSYSQLVNLPKGMVYKMYAEYKMNKKFDLKE